MSDALHQTDGRLLDIVDDAWLADTLPDDDVPLPVGLQAPTDDTDDAHLEALAPRQEKWHELGLHGHGAPSG